MQAASKFEQTRIAFQTLMDRSKREQRRCCCCDSFADITPFDTDEIIKAGRSLLTANVPAKDLTNTLALLGDIASGQAKRSMTWLSCSRRSAFSSES